MNACGDIAQRMGLGVAQGLFQKKAVGYHAAAENNGLGVIEADQIHQ